MYQNTIYICISRYSKICWFPVKKCWCQHNSRGLSRDLYIFWIFFGWGITAKFHRCRICVTGFREGRPRSPHPWAAPKKLILNRVKMKFYFYIVPRLYICNVIEKLTNKVQVFVRKKTKMHRLTFNIFELNEMNAGKIMDGRVASEV